MTLIVVIETADKTRFSENFFGDCSADACFGDNPLVAVTTIRGEPRKVFIHA
jgi:hypothetical protein